MASIIIFMAICYVTAQGSTALYKAYYQTGTWPTPDVFSSVAYSSFVPAISLAYMLETVRKHYGKTAESAEQSAR